ncbi:DoxX family protein [Dongia sp. agr-C8]
MSIPVLSAIVRHPFWQRGGLLLARLIVAAIFLMACGTKFADIAGTATYIANAGFPMAMPLAWIAAVFEALLAVAFLTGILMREAALLAALYLLFLAFAFHGPQSWGGNHMEFGVFVDHFAFAAGLLYMTAFGPGPLGIRR